MSDNIVFMDAETLENFMRDVFIGLGVPKRCSNYFGCIDYVRFERYRIAWYSEMQNVL